MSSSTAPPLDRSSPPLGGNARPFHFPSFQRHGLANGLEILAVPSRGFPLVSLEVLLPAGAQYEGTQAGLATLHANLLDEGAAGKNALEIARLVDQLGGSLRTSANWDIAWISLELLSEHLETGLELLSQLTMAPSFEEREVERLQELRLADLLRRRNQPAILARKHLTRAIYGSSVYAHDLLGEEETVRALGREQVMDFYSQHVTAKGSTLIAAGDFEPEGLFERIGAYFSEWQTPPPPERPEISPELLERNTVHIVDRPGSVQTQLELGHAAVPRNHPDFVALLVLNGIFGGKFSSRINLNLRETHGYTYGANSHFIGRQGPGPFLVRTAVDTQHAGAAVGELLKELRRLLEEPVSTEELEATQEYLTGVFPYTLQSLGSLAGRLENLALFDLPDSYYETYLDRIRAVTPEDLQSVAHKHLHPDRLAIVAVGPREELQTALEPFGPIEIHEP